MLHSLFPRDCRKKERSQMCKNSRRRRKKSLKRDIFLNDHTSILIASIVMSLMHGLSLMRNSSQERDISPCYLYFSGDQLFLDLSCPHQTGCLFAKLLASLSKRLDEGFSPSLFLCNTRWDQRDFLSFAEQSCRQRLKLPLLL